MGKLINTIIEFFKSIFGLNKKSQKLSNLEAKVKASEDKLKEIENEDTNIDDVINRLNK